MKKWYHYEATWHVLFWISYFVLRMAVVQMYSGSFFFRLGMELIEFPLKAFTVYTFIYVLVKRLLLQKKYLLFCGSALLLTFMVMWLNRLEDYFIIYPLTQTPLARYDAGFWSFYSAFFNLVYVYPVLGMGTTIYFVSSWFEAQLAREKLAREKAEIELKSLKDQIHPHFLFNTLNNIYSLALLQSDKTAEMMLRLSKLLSFMVYDGNAPSVPLSRELQALQDYVALEKLRLGERLEISFQATGSVQQATIAPLLLFPLVENCFKHGSHQTSEKIWVRFQLHASPTGLDVQIENSLPGEENKQKTNRSGLGLINVKKRLALVYPQHELRIHASDTYLVNLKIKWN
ncbi:MAG: sensor histidine kinase [Bacteroidota bacterium]